MARSVCINASSSACCFRDVSVQLCERVLQRREVQKRHGRISRWDNMSLCRIKDCYESLVGDATVFLFRFLSHIVGEFANFANVLAQRVSKIAEGVWEDIGVSKTQHCAATGLCQRDAISKVRIAKTCVV